MLKLEGQLPKLEGHLPHLPLSLSASLKKVRAGLRTGHGRVEIRKDLGKGQDRSRVGQGQGQGRTVNHRTGRAPAL